MTKDLFLCLQPLKLGWRVNEAVISLVFFKGTKESTQWIPWGWCDNIDWSILTTAVSFFQPGNNYRILLFCSPKSYQIYLELPKKGPNKCPLATCKVHCSLSCFFEKKLRGYLLIALQRGSSLPSLPASSWGPLTLGLCWNSEPSGHGSMPPF